jgi:hypothetical protein
MLAHIPTVPMVLVLSDKLFLTLFFLLLYLLVLVAAAVLGNLVSLYDLLRFSRIEGDNADDEHQIFHQMMRRPHFPEFPSHQSTTGHIRMCRGLARIS